MSLETKTLEAARAGDRHAMEQVLSHVEPLITRFGLRICGDSPLTDDVMQDTRLAAFQALPGFRGDAELSTWLFTVMRHFCMRRKRRHAGEPEQHEALDSPLAKQHAAGDDPERDAQTAELRAHFTDALVSLRDEFREVLVRKDLEGQTVEAIAQALGETPAAIKSRLHRARAQLKEALERGLT